MSGQNFFERLIINKRARLVVQGALIILVVFLAYLPALHGGFIWDDDDYVTESPTLHDLEGLRRIWFEAGAIPQYYPLVHTVFWLEYHLWGLNPFGYHLINVLLHAVAAILLWRVLLGLQISGAWLAAVIFALHPVCVESVAWITECKNVLSIVFYFAAALAYLRFVALGDAGFSSRRRWCYYLGALALFTAALLSKTVTCSLPAALLLVCWWKKERLRRDDILPLFPFFLIGLASGLVTMWVEKHYVGAQGSEWSLTLGERCLIAGRALWFYADKLIWPVQLTFIYPRWEIATDVWWQWLFPIAAVCVVAGLWLARCRIGKGPLAAVLFFVGTLGPSLGFVNMFPMRYSFVADHFQYLASVGLIALCASGLNRIPRIVPAMLIVMLGVLTWQQTSIYRNLEILWRDTLAKNPGCWMAHCNLGVCLYDKGRIGEAMDQYQEAIRLHPNSFETLNNIGLALAAQGHVDEAIEDYRKAIQIHPNYYVALYNLGLALAAKGQLDEAIEDYRKAIQINPNFVDSLNNLGHALAAKGRFDEAIENYHKAIQINPNLFISYDYLGQALSAQGRFDEATGSYRKAIQIDPHHADTYFDFGTMLNQSGRTQEAVVQYREALKLNPELAGALNNLAWVLAASSDNELRNGAEAVRLAERACELTHNGEPLFLGTLAAAYAECGRFADAITTAEKAEHLATTAGLKNLAEKNRQLLELYRAGKPYHEPQPSKP